MLGEGTLICGAAGAGVGVGEGAPIGIFRLGIFKEGFAGSAGSADSAGTAGAETVAGSTFFKVTVPLLSGSAVGGTGESGTATVAGSLGVSAGAEVFSCNLSEGFS